MLGAGSDSRVSGCLKEKERTDDYVLQLEGPQGLSDLTYTVQTAHTGPAA